MAERYSTQNLNNLLTQFAVEDMRAGGPPIGEQIFPVVHVPKTLFKYRIFNGVQAMTDDFDAIRAPKDKSNEISRSYSSQERSLQQYGLRELIADEERDNADNELNLERDAVNVITGKLHTKMEQAAITLMMNESIFSNTAGAQAKWDATTTYIENDIRLAKLSVLKESGNKATDIVIPATIAGKMAATTEIRDLVKYTDHTLLVDGTLPPKLFGLKVHIPTMIKNEANAGITTASYDFICDDFDVFVGYVEPRPSLRTMSAGYTFRRKIAGNAEIAVFKYYNNELHGTWIECLIEQLVVQVCTDCGYVITDVDD